MFRYWISLIIFSGFLSAQVSVASVRVDDQSDDESFMLTAVNFSESSFIDSFDFFHIYESYLGSQISVAQLKQICRQITQYYREHDLATAECVLPPQTITGGVVDIYLIEGVINDVRLTGDVAANDPLFVSYLKHIPLGQPLSIQQAGYIEELFKSVPGTRASIYIKPIENTIQFELIIDVKVTKYKGEVYINNRGSKVVGPVQLGVAATSNSLFGRHEKLTLNLLAAKDTDELDYADVSTAWPFGNAGSQLIVIASHGGSKPGDVLASANIDASITIAKLGWDRPLFLSRDTALSLVSSIDYYKSESDYSSGPLEFSELYKLKFKLSYKLTSSYDLTESSIAITHALAGMNTTKNAASGFLSTGKEDFDVVRFDLYYSRALTSNLLFSFLSQAQYASDQLPVSEFIAFGGETLGTAYDPAEFFGNHGLGGKIRLGYRFANSWVPAGYTQMYVHNDVVKVWNEDTDTTDSGASLAVGMVFGAKSFSLDLQIAQPLTRTVKLEGDDDARGFANFRYFF